MCIRDRGEGRRVHADRAPLVALAVEHGHRTGGLVDVLRMEGERLGDAQAAAVEDGDQRAVADPGRRPARAGAQQAADLLGGEELGREAPALVGRRSPEPGLEDRGYFDSLTVVRGLDLPCFDVT